MYHIARDKRAERSASLIGEGMLRLLEKEPLEKISILALNQETGVSRATFYRLFDRVEDVLEYLCDTIVDEIGMELNPDSDSNQKEILIKVIEMWLQYDSLLECLSKNRMMDLLCSAHLKRPEYVYSMMKLNQPVSEEQLEYLCYLLSYLMTMNFDLWVRHGKKDPPEFIYEQFIRSYPALQSMFTQ